MSDDNDLSRPRTSSNFIEKLIEATQVTDEKCIKNDNNVIKNIDLSKFKLSSCPNIDKDHNFLQCPFYHSNEDRRRDFSKVEYSSFICEKHVKNERCKLEDYCKLSLNLVESYYHPYKYKKSFCKYFPYKLDNCPYGIYCYDAHSEQEIKVDLLHNYTNDDDFYLFKYKTEICPFKNKEHDYKNCVYSHCFNDMRRDIIRHPYANYKCDDFNGNSCLFYNESCRKGVDCTLAHGYYEYNYHPLNYKRSNCKNFDNCQIVVGCPFLHKNEESKYSEIDDEPYFYLAPINRVIHKKQEGFNLPVMYNNIMYEKKENNIEDHFNNSNSSYISEGNHSNSDDN